MTRMCQKKEALDGEKRKHHRTGIQLWAKEYDNNSSRFHMVSNISQQGLLIRKKLPLSIGSVINLELDLDDPGGPMTFKCAVTNNYLDSSQNISGTGIKFIDMTAELKQKLAFFLTKIKA